MMNSVQFNMVFGFFVGMILNCSFAVAQTVLYADDFNRADSKSVGKTSYGAYSWVDPFYHSFEVKNQTLRAVNQESSPNIYAYVDYDLDSVPKYDVFFKATTTNTTESGSYAGLFLLPRTLYLDTVVSNRGWVVNRNFWDPSGSGTYTRFYWYDGSDRNEVGSIPVTRIDTNQFLAIKWQEIKITVRGDYASLRVTQDNGASLIDANRYIGNYDTATKSAFLFAKRSSIARTTTGSKVWIQCNIDDLEVSVPRLGSILSVR